MKFTAPKSQETPAEPLPRNWIVIGVVGAVVALLLVAALAIASTEGCRNDSAELVDRDDRGKRILQGSQAHLVRAFTLLEHVEDYQRDQAIAQIMAQLGQWIAEEPPIDEWSVDALTSSLPKQFAARANQHQLAAMEFNIQDYFALSEVIWTRDISNWQVREMNARRAALQHQIDEIEDQLRSAAANARAPLEAQLAEMKAKVEPAWLAEARKSQGDAVADQLATAAQLFDWTVRNVQLEPTHWDAVLPDAPPDPDSKEPFQVPPPPPGAELHAWDALLLGRGDAATRARIFLLLARQQKIEVVILGLKNEAVGGEPHPWAAGVVVGDQIYLFDPELGLPIPGPNDSGIATLAMLREKPELLRQLDLPGAPYSITADDLSHVVALIDATPAALSQRMLLIEQNLPPELKLVLTTKPSQLQRTLRKLGLAESRIWAVPYRVFLYDIIRQRDPQANAKLNGELAAIYNVPLPLFAGRMYHFRGQLEAKPPDYSAKSFYLACRKPDREILTIATSPELRKEMIARNPGLADHPEMLEAMLTDAQQATIGAKRQATYWLGLVAYEDEEFGAAIDYFRERTLKADPDGPRTHGARYNLARVFEESGQRDEAIALYEAGGSPQKHGNLIRARRLRGEQPPTPSS